VVGADAVVLLHQLLQLADPRVLTNAIDLRDHTSWQLQPQ